MKTLTFIKHNEDFLVKELNYICSLPKIYTGNLVCIENYSAGIGHSAHPNIDASGSVSGIKKLGYWRNTDRIIRSHGFYYNMSSIVTSDPLDELCLAIEQGRAEKTVINNQIIYNF